MWWFPANVSVVNGLQWEKKRPINWENLIFSGRKTDSCYSVPTLGNPCTYVNKSWCYKVLQSIMWWWYIRRMRSSQPGILWIFWTPYSQTLVIANPCKSMYVHTTLSMGLSCIFLTYDSLRPCTLVVLHLILNSWDCDVIVSYNCNFRLPAHSLLCRGLKTQRTPGWEEHFLLIYHSFLVLLILIYNSNI